MTIGKEGDRSKEAFVAAGKASEAAVWAPEAAEGASEVAQRV